jgi:hypothetical protein
MFKVLKVDYLSNWINKKLSFYKKIPNNLIH